MCTGLEPLVAGMLGAGASAATVGAVATGVGALGAGMAASAIMKPKMPSAAAIPTPQAPPQTTKAADRTVMLATNAAASRAAGAFSGNSSTFLTGAGGIGASSLNLGRNTLLGS